MSNTNRLPAAESPNSAVDAAKRALRHQAHRYHTTKDETKDDVAERLYASARAMYVVEGGGPFADLLLAALDLREHEATTCIVEPACGTCKACRFTAAVRMFDAAAVIK